MPGGLSIRLLSYIIKDRINDTNALVNARSK